MLKHLLYVPYTSLDQEAQSNRVVCQPPAASRQRPRRARLGVLGLDCAAPHLFRSSQLGLTRR
jgi:hypothetical protein